MTSGNKTYDTRGPSTGPTQFVGEIYNKVWSGADKPKVTTHRPPVFFGYRSTVIRARRGKGFVNIVYRFKYPTYSSASFTPERARLPENAYSASWFRRKSVTFLEFPAPTVPPSTDPPQLLSTDQAGFNITPGLGSASNATIACVGKLRDAIAGSDFNLGVSLGEAGEAFSMIGNTATRIYQAYRNIRQGNIYGAAINLTGHPPHKSIRPSKVVAENWLQLQYGWLPLIKDVQNGAEFLAHHFNVPLQNVVRATARTKQGGGFSSSSPTNITKAEIEYLEKVSIKAILREKNVYALAGLTDPLSIAWELTPYSFVADWFIPIGSWLQARQLSSAIEATYVISTLTKATAIGMTSTNISAHGNIPAFYHERGAFTRTVQAALVVPIPTFKPFGKAASVKHCINAVALLINRFSSHATK
jgi:hypothetical protein